MNRKERRRLAYERGEIGQAYRESLQGNQSLKSEGKPSGQRPDNTETMKPVPNAKPLEPKKPIRQGANSDATERPPGCEPAASPVGAEGDGVPVRTASGLRVRTEQRLLARAANWQQIQRFPLDKTIIDGEIVDPTEGKPTIYEEILENAVVLMRSGRMRDKSLGVRAGLQMARLVQADDHAKLRAELRPTPIATIQKTSDEPPAVESRRVVVLLPDNGRDPDLKSYSVGSE